MPTPPDPKADVTPDPRTLADDKSKALAVLLRAKASGPTPWVSAAEISKTLRDEYGIRLHWRTVETLLSQDRKLADRRKRRGRWEFAVMKLGEDLLNSADAPIVVVDPTRAVQAVVTLQSFLSALRGTIRLCDPYLDSTTIEHLDACQADAKIQLLTQNIKDTGALRRLVAAAATQGRSLAIRVAPTAPLHDRYIIDDGTMLILGTSLNGFGKKQCFVTKAGPDIRAMVIAIFDATWAAARPWP